MHNGDEPQPLDQRKILIGKIIHQLIRRGWRPPRQMPLTGSARLLEDIARAGERGATNRLSPGQVRIVALMSEGYTAKRIARSMGISEDTVKSQQRHARRKLGARNANHVVAIAIREGEIE